MADARRSRSLAVVGAPTSAGSYAAGQEEAPRVLRDHGLIDALRASGRIVRDAGDGPLQVWHPDHGHPLTQNFEEAAAAVRETGRMVGEALDSGDDVLVIGGNCTVALGVMSALVARDPSGALIYVDRHFDLNTPDSTSDGALDWMGLAAGLGILSDAPDFGFPRHPLLTPEQVLYLGVDIEAATQWERDQVSRLELAWRSSERLAHAPAEQADAALAWLDGRPFAVHLDVDALDFIDLPLAENTDGRNSGPSLAAVTDCLRPLCATAGCRILSIGEVNPSRAAGDSTALPRLITALADLLAPGNRASRDR